MPALFFFSIKGETSSHNEYEICEMYKFLIECQIILQKFVVIQKRHLNTFDLLQNIYLSTVTSDIE